MEQWPASGALPEEVRQRARRRAGLVQKAVADWKTALVDLGGRNNLLHYRDLKRGTLDLTVADSEAVSDLLLGKTVRVSALFSDPEERDQALRRVRVIHNKAKENFEERGLQTLSIGCGLASWDNKRATWEPCAPVLLQPAMLHPLGASQDDFELAVIGETMGVNHRQPAPAQVVPPSRARRHKVPVTPPSTCRPAKIEANRCAARRR